MEFWLGTHKVSWLRRTDVPLMVSRRALMGMRRIHQARGPIVVDSGGFTEIAMYGEWRTPIDEFVIEMERIADEAGRVVWMAPQDWMSEPAMLQKTGLDVPAHQQRTVSNYLALRDRRPELPWIPVLQGWTERQHHACADMYEAEGVDLGALPVVGLGTVCRRQATAEIELIVRSLAERGYGLHGFGMKRGGLVRCADVLASADSLAWSYDARRGKPLAGCTHRSCANCMDYALAWRKRLLATVEAGLRKPHQFPLVAA